MTASNYRGAVKGMLKGDGSKLFKNDYERNAFAKELRADSRSRSYGKQGFTKKDVEKFFAQKLNDKTDTLTDAKVKKLAKIMGASGGHVLTYAAQMRREQAQQKRAAAAAQRMAQKEKNLALRNKITDITKSNPVSAMRAGQEAQARMHVAERVQQHVHFKPDHTQEIFKNLPTQSHAQGLAQFAPPQKGNVHEIPVLFSKSEKAIQHAAEAKQLIAKINDPENYEHTDDS